MYNQSWITKRLILVLQLVLPASVCADDRDQRQVGLQPDGRILVPTNQFLRPAGKQVTFPGRPVDLLLIDEGRTLVAKNMRDLVFIDVASGKIKQVLALPPAGKGLGGAFSAVGLISIGDRILATDSQNAGARSRTVNPTASLLGPATRSCGGPKSAERRIRRDWR